LLKPFCDYVTDNVDPNNHVIAANEGNAVAIGAGYHMATGKYPLVYMQNSGVGNTMNPLLSLTHKQVYSIPMLLLIGWRGEPGKRDEPQHMVMGSAMHSLLTDVQVPFDVLPDYKEGMLDAVNTAMFHMQTR